MLINCWEYKVTSEIIITYYFLSSLVLVKVILFIYTSIMGTNSMLTDKRNMRCQQHGWHIINNTGELTAFTCRIGLHLNYSAVNTKTMIL